MLIAGLSITDAIPVIVAALVGFFVVQGLSIMKEDHPEKPAHKINWFSVMWHHFWDFDNGTAFIGPCYAYPYTEPNEVPE